MCVTCGLQDWKRIMVLCHDERENPTLIDLRAEEIVRAALENLSDMETRQTLLPRHPPEKDD